MCFSKDLSLKSFLFGIISSLALLFFGNKSSYNTNIVIASSFIFISFMQLIEYFIWSDIKCLSGLNFIGSLLGPLFNHLQPVFIFLFMYYFLNSNNIINNNIILSINLLYIFYVIYKYIEYIKINKNKICTDKNKEGHLDWLWKYNFKYIFYYIILILNFINYSNNKNLGIILLVSFILLIISYFKYHHNIGEFWCLFVTGVPLINLFVQRVFNINN